MKAVLSLALSSVFFLGAAPLAKARQLNQEAIRALFPGTFDVSFKHKTHFVVTARANGSLSGRRVPGASGGRSFALPSASGTMAEQSARTSFLKVIGFAAGNSFSKSDSAADGRSVRGGRSDRLLSILP
jgi:hypothetical protein